MSAHHPEIYWHLVCVISGQNTMIVGQTEGEKRLVGANNVLHDRIKRSEQIFLMTFHATYFQD